MANNILIQWQGVAQTIADIQSALNTLTASTLPGVSGAAAGQFAVVNAAGTGYILVPLSGDVSTSSTAPGAVTVLRVNGNPVAATVPTTGQIWVWNGTTFTPVSIGGDGTISAAGVLTLSKFGGVTPAFVAGAGITITGAFPAYTISSTGAASGFTNLSTITNGASGSNTQSVTIQLKDNLGNNIAAVQKIEVYMATDSAGAVPSTSGANTAVTATTGAILAAITPKLYFHLVTNSSGTATLLFDNTNGATTYQDRLVLVLPTGQLVVGAALFVQSTAYTPATRQMPIIPPSTWRLPITMGP